MDVTMRTPVFHRWTSQKSEAKQKLGGVLTWVMANVTTSKIRMRARHAGRTHRDLIGKGRGRTARIAISPPRITWMKRLMNIAEIC